MIIITAATWLAAALGILGAAFVSLAPYAGDPEQKQALLWWAQVVWIGGNAIWFAESLYADRWAQGAMFLVYLSLAVVGERTWR